VVCGWSYGGMVITGLELSPDSHLVYLCSLMPDQEETFWSLAGEAIGAIEADVSLDLTDEGEMVLNGAGIDALLWPDAPTERADAVRAAMRPQVTSTYFTPPVRIAWRNTPSTYVASRHDPFFAHLIPTMSERATNTVTWDTSHSPVLSRPDLVIELLDDLAS
jgi:hypothetical protein